MANQDPTLGVFGTNKFAVPDLPEPRELGTVQPQPSVESAAGTLDEQMQTARVAEAKASRDARAARDDSSALAGAGAAVMLWDTTRLVKRLGRPTFDDDTPINQAEYLNNTGLNMTEDEREYFLDVGVGVKSAQYAIDQITTLRKAAEVLGDHPVVGLATSFVDPLWLAVPPAIRIGKLAGKTGRAVSGVASGTIAAGATTLGEGPVSDAEIALNFVLNAAIGTAVFKPGKGLVREIEEGFPAAKIDEVLTTTEAALTEAVQKPKYRLVQPEKWDDVDVPAVPERFEFQEIRSPELDAAKPGYSYQDKRFMVEFDNPIDKAAYIVAGRGKSKAHEVIKDWAEQTAGISADELIIRGQRIRDDLKMRAKDSPEGKLRISAAEEFKPRVKRVLVEAAQPATKERRKVQEAVWEEVPKELMPGAVNTDPVAVVKAVQTGIQQEAKARGIGHKLMWNMHKTMSGFGTEGKRIADLLYDNNSDLGLTSLEAHRESIRDTLRVHQFEYEDLLRQSMADDGFGLMKMVNPFTSRAAYAKQQELESAVHRELMRREQFTRQGIPINSDGIAPRITAMADKLDAMHAMALREMKAAGVEGAENLFERPGYLNRKWNSTMIDNVIGRLEKLGLTREAAHSKVVDLVGLAVRRANSMDAKMSRQIGEAIVDRALNRGYFEDSAFNAPSSAGQLAELRDILKGGGMAHDEIERALNVLRVASDDAGKQGFMKHRMDLDYKATIRVGNEEVSVMDLIDSRVTTIVDQYVQRVSTTSALARKGIRKPSDLADLRSGFLASVPTEQRTAARDLFNNTIAHYRGDPAGVKVNENFRLMQAYGRSIALAWSGLWQLTEVATAMGEYGLMKTLRYASQEIPGFKQIMRPDKESATSLNTVLANHSIANMRMRPFIARFEDGYEMDTGSAMQLSSQTIGQMVPFANAMKFVHHAQAKAVGNLILDRVRLASGGNVKAREALARYGLESPLMDKLSAEIKKHGFEVDQWDDAVWADARPAFGKMMDAAVLKGRLGDVPAFAAFDSVGKFVFTYRTFVLTAHNKVLAGMLERNGAGAVGLVMMYQLPLALAAVQAQAAMRGDKQLSEEDLIKKALGQMGGLGLFSEPLKWATGESNAWGASGLIPIDRGVKLFKAGVNLDPRAGASTALTMLPVVSAVPFLKGIPPLIKE